MERILLACESAGFTLRLGAGAVLRAGCVFTRFRSILKQMFHCGVVSFPVVALVGAFSGMVLALQAGIQLGEWGQEEKIGIIRMTTATNPATPSSPATHSIPSTRSRISRTAVMPPATPRGPPGSASTNSNIKKMSSA